ncbi:hypothetical protein Q7A53_12160 [Halobacillus rhizosphaerae]|uniref:hypothetical protein n=1 Tax=Halobacillus rhizosphaerae TaxID=3064889 RepID=UPI00398B3F59
MMRKRTTVKWFSGIASAVMAASFIGFVQNHQVEGVSNQGAEQQQPTHSEDSIFSNPDDSNDTHDFFGNDDRSFDGSGFEDPQGMAPSERRTRHS